MVITNSDTLTYSESGGYFYYYDETDTVGISTEGATETILYPDTCPVSFTNFRLIDYEEEKKMKVVLQIDDYAFEKVMSNREDVFNDEEAVICDKKADIDMADDCPKIDCEEETNEVICKLQDHLSEDKLIDYIIKLTNHGWERVDEEADD